MGSDNDTPRNKVQKIIERRGLSSLGDELEQRWRGDGFEQHSVRELTEHFNRTILNHAITEAGSIPMSGEVANIHELLTDDEVPDSTAMQVRERLKEYGVDPDDVENGFVSHQTMYRYLRRVRDVDTSQETKSTEELIESTHESILRLSNRMRSVVAQGMDTLQTRDGFALGEYDIYISVEVSCNDCGVTRDISQLFAQSGCDCSDT